MSEKIIFDYAKAPRSDSVIIIAGGWSVSSNLQKIRDYQIEHNSTVFSANYHHDIPIHYTYFADPCKIREQYFNVKSNIIIPPRLKSSVRILNQKEKKKNRKSFHVIKLQPGSDSIYGSGRVKITDDGTFPYCLIGTAGLASIVVSLLCRPKRMLLVGFDGSTPDASVKRMFDGSTVKYNKPEKRAKEVSYFTNSLMPTLHKLGIVVESFENVLFYGLSKDQLGIRVI